MLERAQLDDLTARVYRFAVRLTGDPNAAEDLTQETLLRGWQQAWRLREPRALMVWLLTTAHNLWRDQWRRQRLRVGQAVSLDADPPCGDIAVEERASLQEDLVRALAAVDRLPNRQREVLYLTACEGLSLGEVARVVGITRSAAKASLSLARKTIREMLPDVSATLEPCGRGEPS